jgi:hypothetical protein
MVLSALCPAALDEALARKRTTTRRGARGSSSSSSSSSSNSPGGVSTRASAAAAAATTDRHHRALCALLGGTTSLWTIDLAHLLARLLPTPQPRVVFCTATLGVDLALVSEPFYERAIDADAARVRALFASAAAAGASVERRSLSAAELAALVAGTHASPPPPLAAGRRHLAVVLVDKRRLGLPSSSIASADSWWASWADYWGVALADGGEEPARARAKRARGNSWWPSAAAPAEKNKTEGETPAAGFVGHFVLVAGYDPRRREFLVHDPDPALPPMPGGRPRRVAMGSLDAARLCRGTDEDVILVPVLS